MLGHKERKALKRKKALMKAKNIIHNNMPDKVGYLKKRMSAKSAFGVVDKMEKLL